MKLIALDVGSKRIGVAKADSTVRIAIPYSAVEVDGTEFKKIASLARAWDIDSFVIGLPRNSKGEETEQSRYVRKFAQQLKHEITGAKVCFQDESPTSVEAEKRLKNRKKGYKKGDIDSEAAAIILQDFLEQRTGKPTSRASAAKHKSVKGNKSNRLVTIVVSILILLGVVAAAGYGYYRYSLSPVMSDSEHCSSDSSIAIEGCDNIKFTVNSGASVNEIAASLKEANLIRDELVFQVYMRLHAGGKSLKAGEYELNDRMSVNEIVDVMIKGGRDNVFSLTIFPGETVRQIKQKLIEHGYNSEAVETAFSADYSGKDYSWIFEGRPEEASLEGYIFGETYEFYKDDTVETIIETTLEELAVVIKENDLKAKFEAQGLNLYQGVTLASIVQKEANNATDYAKVAQVFYNRLRNDDKLGSDVTTQYAVDLVDPDRAEYTDNAMALEIDSPYNTRKYAGLPPGPISNPGAEALIATATPDESVAEYYFFLTGDDGLMYYSITDAEHQQNIIDHCQQLCNVAL